MVEWLPANKNEYAIETIAFEPIDKYGEYHRTIGYNGFLKGEKVNYKDKQYTIVMVSRLGDFGLSETGELPYILRVSPKEVTKI